MSDDKSNLKDRINKAMKTPAKVTQDPSGQSDNYEDKHSESDRNIHYQENSTGEEAKSEAQEKVRRKQRERPLKLFGTICIAAAIIAFVFTGTSTVDTSQSAKNALENKVSTAVSAGTILLSKDENVGAKDYTIAHKSDVENTKIWVWDYAAEDGDYVQVLVNGTPVADGFMIKHKPMEITVPSTGKVQIKGIKDGGGGITYAVRYDINGTSYFNGTPEGEFNTYTLTKE